MDANALIHVEHLKKYFDLHKRGTLMAVDDVSFDIRRGETFGLVGESGCGKTTCGRTVIGLYRKTDGKVVYDGRDIDSMTEEDRFHFKKKAQMIFQDPYASLNPRMTVEDIIAEGMDNFHMCQSTKERQERVYDLLHQVGLNKEHAARFPHEFSGGQRQRIGIARALAVEPEFIVCDSGAGRQSACPSAEGKRAYLSFYRTRPLDGEAHLGPCRCHVYGAYCRAGTEQ